MVSPYIQNECDRIAKEKAAMNASPETVVGTFGFFPQADGETLVATNGPIYIVLALTGPTTMKVDETQTNVNEKWPYLAAVVLAAARFRRRYMAD